MTTRRLIGILAAAIAGAASAQTAVTTAGGSSGTVPVFNGASSMTNSVITQSGGNVGIGTTNPATQLGISGNLTETITQTQTAPMQNGSTYTVGGITYADYYLRDSVPSNPAAYMWIRSVNTSSPFPVAIRGTQIEFGTANGLSGQGIQASTAMTINPSGLVGIGTSSPTARFHLADTVGITAYPPSTAFGNANFVVQSAYGARTAGVGSALSFAFPANSDGTNLWEQARILGTPDNSVNSTAAGRLYLQTRTLNPNGSWTWIANLLLASDGSTTVGGNLKLNAGSGAAMTFQDGSVQTVAWNGVLQGGDYAESVDVSGNRAEYEPGDVLVIDPASKGKFLKSSEPYSTAVMGVYSTRPGVVGRRQKTDRSHMKDEVPLAMVGVVPTKVTSEGGAIKAGDLLVTSSRPGYAMKGKDRSLLTGAIIGKALEPLDAGTGVIEVAVSIQ